MFGRRKPARLDFDRSRLEPCIRKSVCTGERTAGFLDRSTGKFEEYALIRSDEDLQRFLDACGVSPDGVSPDDVKTIY